MTDAAPSSDRHAGGFFAAFRDLRTLPRAFWIVILAFAIESMAYFGILTLMTTYLSTDLGWGDQAAGLTVAFFTGSVTLFMLGAGSYAERFGVRLAIIGALVLCVMGRLMYCAPPSGHGSVIAVILASLVIVAIGEAILQPVAYSGIKQYTDERTSAMGYGLIYGVMNLMIFVIGAISSEVRPGVQRVIDARAAAASAPASGPGAAPQGAMVQEPEGFWAQLWHPINAWLTEHVYRPLSHYTHSGVDAVNWICLGITAATLLGFLLLMTRRAETAKLRPDRAPELRRADTRPLYERIETYFTEGPFTNARFLFFIFMLLPVRTLFAHQWLTMPQYIVRAYSPAVGDNMEKLVNWINPMIIFFGVPIATALTRRVNVYTMMIVGSFVSAVPTFLLATPPNLTLLITYMVLFSIGEALWSARFLEYASELAPEGRIAQYMGLASIPWLLAKTTTGLYSGWMLIRFCPGDLPRDQLHTETMWFIYGCIAMLSPIGLWLSRRWVMAGLHAAPAPDPNGPPVIPGEGRSE